MFGAAAADACSYAGPVPGQKPAKPTLRDVDVAIFGKVVAIKERSPTFYEATLRVWRVYKGRVARTIRIRYTTQSSACGTTFADGEVVALSLNRSAPFWAGEYSRERLRFFKDATRARWHRPKRS